MLIKINPGYLRIKKESMNPDQLERLTKYLYEVWVDFDEDLKTIVIKGKPELLYKVLYRISLNFDIELM